jgi:hypothetical protein
MNSKQRTREGHRRKLMADAIDRYRNGAKKPKRRPGMSDRLLALVWSEVARAEISRLEGN